MLDAKISSRNASRSLTPLYLIGIALAAVTGVIHLWLGITEGKLPLIVGGLGFAVGIVAVGLDVRRRQFVELGIPFTAGQIVLYTVAHYPNRFGTIELVDKAVQVVLVALLVVLLRRS